eukprot:1194538-Prorocentrum_minimum.AAC.1
MACAYPRLVVHSDVTLRIEFVLKKDVVALAVPAVLAVAVPQRQPQPCAAAHTVNLDGKP